MSAEALRLALLLPVAALSACESSGDGTGTNINISGSDNGSDVAITADGETGKVAINVPGFEAKVALPKIALGSANFDLDGVKLYPGSKVTNVDINSGEIGASDRVKIAFSAPAVMPKVRDYFLKAFSASAAKVTPTASGLSGTDKDGAPFAIMLEDSGAQTTRGTIAIESAAK